MDHSDNRSGTFRMAARESLMRSYARACCSPPILLLTPVPTVAALEPWADPKLPAAEGLLLWLDASASPPPGKRTQADPRRRRGARRLVRRLRQRPAPRPTHPGRPAALRQGRRAGRRPLRRQGRLPGLEPPGPQARRLHGLPRRRAALQRRRLPGLAGRQSRPARTTTRPASTSTCPPRPAASSISSTSKARASAAART